MSRKIKVLAPIALALGVSGALFGLGPAGSGEQVAKADVCVLNGLVDVQAPGDDVNVVCPPRVGGYLYGNGGWHDRDDCWDRCDWNGGWDNRVWKDGPDGRPPVLVEPWKRNWNWCWDWSINDYILVP